MRPLIAFVLLLLLAAPASAQSLYGDPGAGLPRVRAARRSPVGRTVLPNGLTVLVQEAPAEDIVALEMLVRVGLAQEQEAPHLAGITRLLQEVLVNRIARDAQGNDRLEILGTVCEGSAEPDYARLSILTDSRHLPEMLRRLGQALSSRELTSAEVERVRTRMLENLEEGRGAFSQLYEIFLQSFYRYHPYRRSGHGSQLALQRLEPATVEPFFRRYYVPNRMVLSVAGRVSRSEVLEEIRRRFSALAAGQETEVNIPWEPQATEREVRLHAGSPLAWVLLGYPAPGVGSSDHAAMTTLQAILAEGLSSRLWTELREKRGLAYELGSVYPPLKSDAHFMAYVVTRPEEAFRVRRVIAAEVERLRRVPVSLQELEQTRRKLEGNYLLARETNRGKAFHLALAEILGVGYEADLHFLEELAEVTPADVQRVARRYLENPTLIVARPWRGRFYLDDLFE